MNTTSFVPDYDFSDLRDDELMYLFAPQVHCFETFAQRASILDRARGDVKDGYGSSSVENAEKIVSFRSNAERRQWPSRFVGGSRQLELLPPSSKPAQVNPHLQQLPGGRKRIVIDTYPKAA